MDTKPAGATAAPDVAALALQLLGQISAMTTMPPSAVVSLDEEPGESPAAPAWTAPAAGPAEFTGPRQMLENASRFVSPVLPAQARLRGVKALLLRILRIVTRDQSVFNSALLESVRGALAATEQGLKEVTAAVAAARSDAARAGEAANRRASELELALEKGLAALAGSLREELAREAEARVREEAARDALGKDVGASQRRLDELEKDRDARFEALARRHEKEENRATKVETGLATATEETRRLKLEWSSLRSSLKGLAAERHPAAREQTPASAGTLKPDDPFRAGLYAGFEEQFRGSEKEIRERQSRDAGLFANAPGPVADLGCGRGEFLECVAAAGLEAVGCDANPVMVVRAKEKGLAVDREDLFTWLAARPDGSLGGITAYQVVEHLPPASLFDLVELAVLKLAPGGRLLFETINPESVYAMKWFWMDLSHVRPVPAPSLAHLMSASGLKDVTVDYRSPVPGPEALPPRAAADPAFDAIGRLLFAPQDYAVTGVK
jgi:2-polyprenyl-3-methyl-5-hydroxy-6-metoxy-1,4-benzoquinol methylase